MIHSNGLTRNVYLSYDVVYVMDRIVVEAPKLLVLAYGDSAADVNNERGHLFEEFIAQLLHVYGYSRPRRDRISITADGIELDVVADSSFSNNIAVVECKAYSANVVAQACTSFIGKLQLARYERPGADVHGYLCILPKLVAPGEEVARKAEKSDSRFHYLNADTIIDRLVEREIIRSIPHEFNHQLTSDPAVLVTHYGVFSCVKILNNETHRTDHVLVWGKDSSKGVPSEVVDLLSVDSYASSTTLRTVSPIGTENPLREVEDSSPPVIVTVRGSSSDFEYQFPASPKFFVGRRQALQEVEQVLLAKHGTLVLNAQSGWGKSSLALQVKQMVENNGGYAVVIDSRTANTPIFVVEALREAAVAAESNRLVQLPEQSSWASLQSAISTLERADWKRDAPLLVFFDQFENVFQDEPTTREFRNLALLLNDVKCSFGKPVHRVPRAEVIRNNQTIRRGLGQGQSIVTSV